MISALTLMVAGFTVYVCKNVLTKEKLFVLDYVTIGATVTSILKVIQLICIGVRYYARK